MRAIGAGVEGGMGWGVEPWPVEGLGPLIALRSKASANGSKAGHGTGFLNYHWPA